LNAGFHVFSINPGQMEGLRKRYNITGAKDDNRDAFVLADSVRTSRHCFRPVRTSGSLVIQLREMARMGEELVGEMNRLSNRLREQLHRFHPQMLSLCPSADEPWFWDLVEAAPTPAQARKLRPSKVEAIMCRHHIRRLQVEEVLQELSTPPLYLAPGSTEACVSHIILLLPQLRLIRKQQAACAGNIAKLLQQLDGETSTGEGESRPTDLDILLSMTGLGKVTAVTLLTEAPFQVKERDYETLRAMAGSRP